MLRGKSGGHQEVKGSPRGPATNVFINVHVTSSNSSSPVHLVVAPEGRSSSGDRDGAYRL
ncbi:hypothetical protein EYF80_060747 [Liparis tanakae]|uniref:Uncharacterized protein n=1 Tax=Liparis tanakae TaxID=230148 RepID=A0A4Z2EKW4_9TELE|nr:hypothetical protein EYF80_060747 [Liparis tanakae]